MRKHASLYLLLISLLANLSVAEAGIVRAVDASPPPEAQAAGIASYVLPNGFKIILASYPSAPNARIELVVKTGSKMEGYGETGAAHLLEHMLFKGAGDRASVKSGLTKIGARFNANTAADRTSYFEILPSEPDLIDEAINIEADRFARASFTREDLASEMTVVRNELDQKDSAPGSVLLRAVERQSFFWHGYGRPTIGARSDIEGAPFEVLKSFYKKHYRPDNAFLLVSGNFDKKRVLALASKVFAAVPNPAAPKITSWTRDEARSVTTRSEVFLPTGNAMAMSAWKIPAAYDRQNIALSLASSAICSNDWGSLRKDLLMGRKLATSVSCSGLDRRDAGLFFVVANAGANDDVEILSRVLHQHVESAAASGITQDQLDRSRQEQLHAFERIGSSHDAFATLLSDAEVCGDWRLAFWQLDTIKAITLEEANAALGRWLVSTNRSDALLRRADGKSAPELPKVEDPIARVAGKDWPVVSRQGDPLPQTASELAAATIHIPLDGKDAQAVLISRKTQGDLAWLAFTNDFGNEGALSGRFAACDMASSLFMFGGANMSRDQLDRELEKLQANWDIG
ncbi:MAG: insulinase family protein, partial [Rhodocyclaceae bacterium]